MTWATGRKTNPCLLGFTLLEIMIALAIVGLLLAVAIPTVRSLTAVELRSQAKQIKGLIRDVYGRAVFSGKTHRLLFDFKTNSYWVENSQDEIRLSRVKKEDIEKKADKEEKQIEEEDEEKKTAEQKFQEKFAPVEGALGQKKRLPSDLRYSKIWTDQVQEWVTKGQMAVYFFPNGYTQRSYIAMSERDNPKKELYLSIEPLSGEATIEDEEPDVSADK